MATILSSYQQVAFALLQLGKIRKSKTMRYAEITTPEQLQQSWTDPAVPFISFCFREAEMESLTASNGKLYASYEPIVLEAEQTFTYMDPSSGEMVDVVILGGVYGIRSSDDLEEL